MGRNAHTHVKEKYTTLFNATINVNFQSMSIIQKIRFIASEYACHVMSM